MEDPHGFFTVEIDGKAIEVKRGTTVLEAAVQLGIKIPTLCYHPTLKPEGSCRICVCEMSIEKRGKEYRWFDCACVYPVEDGLKVKTMSEKVRKIRKTLIELMLSRAPDSEILKGMAEEYGAIKDRFESYNKGKDNCILCRLCTRICKEYGKGVIGSAFRGVHKVILSPYGIASELCNGCTACSNVCPTSAIKSRITQEVEIFNWGVKIDMVKCRECGKAFISERKFKEIFADINNSMIKPEIIELCTECRRRLIERRL